MSTPSSVRATLRCFSSTVKSPVVRDWPGSLPSITSPRTKIRDDPVDAVILIGRFFARPGDDQRRTGFVNQDGIHFVNDGEVEIALDVVFQPELHVVSQVIEAEFVIGAVSDIGTISDPALLFIQIVNNVADSEA